MMYFLFVYRKILVSSKMSKNIYIKIYNENNIYLVHFVLSQLLTALPSAWKQRVKKAGGKLLFAVHF